MCQLFQKQMIRKAPSPDGVSPSCLKVCANQLSPIFTQMFNRSLGLCQVPSCFKHSKSIIVNMGQQYILQHFANILSTCQRITH